MTQTRVCAIIGLILAVTLLYGCCSLASNSGESIAQQTSNDIGSNTPNGDTTAILCKQVPYSDQECEYIPYQEEICNDVNYQYTTLCDNPNTPPTEGWLGDWTTYSCAIQNLESQGGTFSLELGCYFRGVKESQVVTKFVGPGTGEAFKFKIQKSQGYNCFVNYDQIPTKKVCNMVTKTRQSCKTVTKYREECV